VLVSGSDTYRLDTDILREITDWLAQAYQFQVKLAGILTALPMFVSVGLE
jgi:hypothetical protein